jgi:hypothetical protein
MEPTPTRLTSLPTPVVHRIVLLLPVDDRLRSIMVCRAWQAAFSERSLWTHLDLPSRRNHLRLSERVGPSEPLLRCAAARAGGELVSLRVDLGRLSFGPLLGVVTANAGSLRELHLSRGFGCDLEARSAERMTVQQAESLLTGAPQLRALTVDGCFYVDNMDEAHRTLRNEAPFGALRVRSLCTDLLHASDAAVSTFAADVAAHPALVELELQFAKLQVPAILDAVVDAAVALRLQSIRFDRCRFSPASAPALSRLSSMAELRSLSVSETSIFEGDSFAATLADALRGNTTLTSLTLEHNRGIYSHPAGDAALLRVVTGHKCLQTLSLHAVYSAHGWEDGNATLGAALGALVAANTPALTKLEFTAHGKRDPCFRPLCEALPANTYLRSMGCNRGLFTEAFKADVLLPAVRANNSLRELDFKLQLVNEEDKEKHTHVRLLNVAMRVVRERSWRSLAP